MSGCEVKLHQDICGKYSGSRYTEKEIPIFEIIQ